MNIELRTPAGAPCGRAAQRSERSPSAGLLRVGFTSSQCRGTRSRLAAASPVADTAARRLPGADRRTQQFELATFVGLGILGVWLIAGAWGQAARFADQRDAIVAALSAEPRLLAANPTNHALTNLTAQPSQGPPAQFEPAGTHSHPS